MGKINLNKLEETDILPFKESRWQHLTKNYGGMWNLRRWDGYCSDKAYYPYKLSNRIIENNIGKSFDLAFSYFCSKVEKRYQYIFLRDFKSFNFRYWRYASYYVDNNGLIQKIHKEISKKPNVILSWDFKQEWKDNGCKPYSKKYERYGKLVVIQGKKFEFQSKDYRYYREYYHQEYLKRKDIKAKKTPKLSMEEFRRILKEKELKEKELNLIKIESHGFDINTSFRK